MLATPKNIVTAKQVPKNGFKSMKYST